MIVGEERETRDRTKLTITELNKTITHKYGFDFGKEYMTAIEGYDTEERGAFIYKWNSDEPLPSSEELNQYFEDNIK
jgi:hypothetical protein